MNKAFKNLISLITTFSMCAAMIGVVNVSAEKDTAEIEESPPIQAFDAAKRPLTVEYMGMGSAPEATGKKSASLTSADASSTTVDKPFWISLVVEKVHDMNLFTDGIYSLEVAFEYDPSYIRPVIGNVDPDTQWHDEIVAANVGSGKDWDEKYTVISVTESDTDTESDRADKLSSRSSWKMCTVCITLDEENDTDLRFKDLTSDGKQYLLKLPFRLVRAPAEGDSDMYPVVLSLIRGPDTFNIGSGKTGENPKAKWNETENQGDAENLQTYFSYPNDINLFGGGTSIESIVAFRMEDELDDDGNPVKDEEENVVTEEIEYQLSKDNNLQGEGFDPEQTTDPHYLSISNLPDNLQLRITSSDMPTVKVNDTEVTVTFKDGKYVTDPFNLDELDKEVNNGFNNTITVQDSGGTEYTILVRRLLQPRIELMPGNSPYGLIERMGTKYGGTWTDTEVRDARDAFDASDPVYKTYGTDPNQFPLFGNSDLYYSTSAWASYKKYNTEMIDEPDIGEVTGPEVTTERVNYDMDPNAIFVYQLGQFTVPSMDIYDEFDNKVNNPTIDATFRVKEQEDQSPCKYSGETDADNSVTEIDAPLVSGTTDTYTLSGKVIRNDVYFINYVYRYTNANGEARRLKISRPVIILSRRGNLILNTDGLISDTDANHLKSNATAIYTGNSLVAYRVADLDGDTDQLINDTDANYLKSNATMLYTSTNQYYRALSELNEGGE